MLDTLESWVGTARAAAREEYGVGAEVEERRVENGRDRAKDRVEVVAKGRRGRNLMIVICV